MIARLLREPLFQFLAIGSMLFGLYGIVGRRSTETPEKIIVSESRITNLVDGFTRTWRCSPNAEELQGLIEDYVRDEVFYREGRAAGLDKDDVIIRRRVRQKMEFLAEDIPEASDEQLEAYLASDPERFRNDDKIAFRHTFLSATHREYTLESDSKQIASVLGRTDQRVDTSALGDPFLLGEEFSDVTMTRATDLFGEDFAKRLFILEKGRWQGPVSSGFGQHFIFITDRVLGGQPQLADVRGAVRREWANAQRVAAEQKLYASLRQRYEIVVKKPPLKAASADATRD